MRDSSPSLPAKIGRYEIEKLLGQGAMGRVMLAQDPVLGRHVAVKVLRDDLGLPPEVIRGLLVRMKNEAQAAARVSHPNIVTLHDMGEDELAGVYLVFEYVEGQNLKERLRSGRLPAAQVARLARELGSALSLAHLTGVFHRDVKPENVMLAASGAKIADFGIARVPDSTLTRTGGLVGTPAYSAPESLQGGAFSPASDQFSLAATLYEAASGERAFPGDDALSVAAKIQSSEPRPFAKRLGLPEAVDRALLRGMQKAPGMRFASCAELGEALASALEQAGGVAPQPQKIQLTPPRRSEGLQPGRVAMGAVAIAIVSALLGYAASSGLPFFGAGMRPVASATTTASSPEPPASKPSAQPRAKAKTGASPPPAPQPPTHPPAPASSRAPGLPPPAPPAPPASSSP